MLRLRGGEINGESYDGRGLSFGLRAGEDRRKEDRRKGKQAENLKWAKHGQLQLLGRAGKSVKGRRWGRPRAAVPTCLITCTPRCSPDSCCPSGRSDPRSGRCC